MWPAIQATRARMALNTMSENDTCLCRTCGCWISDGKLQLATTTEYGMLPNRLTNLSHVGLEGSEAVCIF